MADAADCTGQVLDRAQARFEREHRRLAVGVPHAVPTQRLCRDCGQPIDPRRLAVLPSADRCIACKAAEETGGTRRG